MDKAIMRLFLSLGLGIAVLLGFLLFLRVPTQASSEDDSWFTEQQLVSVESVTVPADRLLEDVPVVVDEIVASGFNRPVQATHAGDGSQRIFVVEQEGYIHIVQEGDLSAEPFLAIPGLVDCCGEQGLLGLAFHPNYMSNGYFYVYYNRISDGASVVARYSVSNAPNLADPDSAQILLTIPQPFSNHNGGQLAFGPDGYLYIGLGDGGSGGDPYNYAQDINSLLGKMLRIDVDGGNPYGIPLDNPYAGRDGADEIWALGLRNPWRFSFDRMTGDLFIGDVGQNLWEEIDYLPAGSSGEINFGWRCMEGTHPYSDLPPCDDPVFLSSLIDPIAEYSHSEGQSVTGGFVYRGERYPAMRGLYFFADYAQGKIWSMHLAQSGLWSTPTLEVDVNFSISAFGEDEAGEVYVLDFSGGNLRRLADARGPAPDLTASRKWSSIPHADPGEIVTYTINLVNQGGMSENPLYLTDMIMPGLSYIPNSMQATQGAVDDSNNPELVWQGSLSPARAITITYQVMVSGAVTGTIVNQAHISSPAIEPLTLLASVGVPRPAILSTQADFFFPGTQPGQLTETIPLPLSCDRCHTEPIYDRWRGSMMSQAGRDPLLWAALAVANHDAPGAGEYCVRCHTPKAWLEGRSLPADGAALQSADIESGVACSICHRMVDPAPQAPNSDESWLRDLQVRDLLTTTLPSTHQGSAMMVIDPEDHRRGPFSLGLDFVYHLPNNTFQANFLGKTQNDFVTRSRLCGACHNVDNPLLSWNESLGQYWLNASDQPAPSFEKSQLFPIETTYDEWLNSQYADAGVYAPQFAGEKPDGVVGACQDCHMTRRRGLAADQGLDRDCQTNGCLPEHTLAGGNTWVPQILQDPRWRLNSQVDKVHLEGSVQAAREMLGKAANLTVAISTRGDQKIATVRVTNESGHKLPTGYPEGRRLWINLKAYDENGNQVYESGAYDPDNGLLDSDAKVYEAKQGLTPELANLLGLPAAESFHFVLNNTVIKDNRIPPRGFTQAALEQNGMQPVGAEYQPGQYWDDTIYPVPSTTNAVIVTLYYQTSSKEYIDFLRAYGGVDGYTLGKLWDGSKSPPVVMAVASNLDIRVHLPLVIK